MLLPSNGPTNHNSGAQQSYFFGAANLMSDPRTTAGHRYAQHGRLGSHETSGVQFSVGLDGAGGGGVNFYGGAAQDLGRNNPAEDAYGVNGQAHR